MLIALDFSVIRFAHRWFKAAMSNPPVACGPVNGFVRPSLGFRCSKSILYSDNLS